MCMYDYNLLKLSTPSTMQWLTGFMRCDRCYFDQNTHTLVLIILTVTTVNSLIVSTSTIASVV